MDRKAINLYTGIGGAYCDFCSLSKEQARDKERVDNGMPKDRDLADTKAICKMLIQGGGQIKASNGLCCTEGFNTNRNQKVNSPGQQILHGMLRSHEFLVPRVENMCGQNLNLTQRDAKT